MQPLLCPICPFNVLIHVFSSQHVFSSRQIKKYPNQTNDRIVGPNRVASADGSPGKLDKKFAVLEEDGLCGVGERIKIGNILVNKEQPLNTSDALSMSTGYKPAPMTYKGPKDMDAYVDQVQNMADLNREVVVFCVLAWYVCWDISGEL
jgi:DNA-directed RNA polymerase III subunit RPC2